MLLRRDLPLFLLVLTLLGLPAIYDLAQGFLLMISDLGTGASGRP